MNHLVRGLTFTICVSIGACGVSVSSDYKGKIKGGVSYSTGSITRGFDACLTCGSSESKEGTGRYIKITKPVSLFTSLETTAYADGKIATDYVASEKKCREEVCLKMAVKERVADNFAEKKGLGLTYPNLFGNSFKLSNKVTFKNPLSIPDIEKRRLNEFLASTRGKKTLLPPAELNRPIRLLPQTYKTDLPKLSLKAPQIRRLLEPYTAYNRTKEIQETM